MHEEYLMNHIGLLMTQKQKIESVAEELVATLRQMLKQHGQQLTRVEILSAVLRVLLHVAETAQRTVATQFVVHFASAVTMVRASVKQASDWNRTTMTRILNDYNSRVFYRIEGDPVLVDAIGRKRSNQLLISGRKVTL